MTPIDMLHTVICKLYTVKRKFSSVFGRISGHLPPGDTYHQGTLTTRGHLPPGDTYHQGTLTTRGHLPPGDTYHQGTLTTRGHLPPGDTYHQGTLTTRGHLPSPILNLNILITKPH